MAKYPIDIDGEMNVNDMNAHDRPKISFIWISDRFFLTSWKRNKMQTLLFSIRKLNKFNVQTEKRKTQPEWLSVKYAVEWTEIPLEMWSFRLQTKFCQFMRGLINACSINSISVNLISRNGIRQFKWFRFGTKETATKTTTAAAAGFEFDKCLG